MRDPKRIDEIMSVITEIWKLYPDTRFNQLLDTIKNEYANKVNWRVKHRVWYLDEYDNEQSKVLNDLFYVEDDEFLKFLKQYRDKLIN